MLPLVDQVLEARPGLRRALVLGCGDGEVVERLVSGGVLRAIGVDPDKANIAQARARRVEARWICAGSDERLDLLDGCVDLVLWMHDPAGSAVPDPARTEAARLLADGGELLIVDATSGAQVESWRRPARTAPVRMHPEDLPRAQSFAFFERFGSPFYELTADVPVGELRQRCRAAGRPFHLVALHAAVRALHDVPELMLRLDEERVVLHPRIQVGSTLLDHDERLGFVIFEAHADLDRFIDAARQATARGRQRATLHTGHGSDIVFFSNVPWVSFRSITHADTLAPGASVPRLTFGRAHERGGEWLLPVSLSAHHALADGLHVGWFFRFLEHHLNEAASACEA